MKALDIAIEIMEKVKAGESSISHRLCGTKVSAVRSKLNILVRWERVSVRTFYDKYSDVIFVAVIEGGK